MKYTRKSNSKTNKHGKRRGGQMALTPAYIDSKSDFYGVSGNVPANDTSSIIDGQGITNYGVGADSLQLAAGQAGGRRRRPKSQKKSKKSRGGKSKKSKKSRGGKSRGRR